ncbi:MAG: 1-acyl-sn-glycerol-3-phosphate acyltransferase [Oscillospiraceae bacterium]|nr:1-acyl-sn-glycerol-3-phosphate acyltransferase [Oscillospiraceae bacterium]
MGAIRALARLFFFIFYRVEVMGIGNVPTEGGAILCANHVGLKDMFLIGYRLRRKVRWMAKEELFRNRLIGRLLRSLGAYPVGRGRADLTSVKVTYRLLDEGELIGIFAEGTRQGRAKGRDGRGVGDGRGEAGGEPAGDGAGKGKAHPGVAMFASKKGVPVIPVFISGTRAFSRIYVVFGEPGTVTAEDGKDYAAISAAIMGKVYGLDPRKAGGGA